MGRGQGLPMGIPGIFSVRARAILAVLALFAAFSPHAPAFWPCGEGYDPGMDDLYLVMRFPNQGGQWVFLPFDENLEVHKGFDATVRYVSASDPSGAPAGWTEAEIGFSLDLTGFTRAGNTLRFNFDAESRQIAGWKSTGMMLRPVFQTNSFHTTPDSGPRSVQCGEWNCLIPGEEATSGIPVMCIGPIGMFVPE